MDKSKVRPKQIWRPRVEVGFCKWAISSCIIIKICFMRSSSSQPWAISPPPSSTLSCPQGNFSTHKNHGCFPPGLKGPIYLSVVFALHAASPPPLCVSVILCIVLSLFSNVPQMEMSKQDNRGAEEGANQTSVSQGGTSRVCPPLP